MEIRVDHASPVPRYHQIAESIRHLIATGVIRAGDQLPPIRQAASQWHVNMHTVRKAYAVLADEELLTMVPHRGTIVREKTQDGSVLAWLDKVMEQGQKKYDLDAQQLIALMKQRSTVDSVLPVAHVVECSQLQAADHAAELHSMFAIEAISHAIDDLDVLPPEGAIVATYFHYNDLRLRWPDAMKRIQFVPIHPDPNLKRDIGMSDRQLLVVELSESKGEHIAADMSHLFPQPEYQISRAVWQPGSPIPSHPGPILFPPRVWALLNAEQRKQANHHKIRYMLDQSDLVQLGATNSWTIPKNR